MIGRQAELSRLALHVVPGEADQVPRLVRFRQEHPDVIIGPGEFGTWQARIPQPAGETVATRHTLRELLDRLDQLTGQYPEQPSGGPS